MSSTLDTLISGLVTGRASPNREPTEDDQSSRIARFPLVYSATYAISFFGLEYLHPFDVHKWEKVMRHLRQRLQPTNFVHFEPNHAIDDHELRVVHTADFLEALHTSRHTLVATSEVCVLYFLPMSTIERRLLNPLRCQTTGTILATYLALRHRVGVNIGGGFHHCSATRSGGFCFFADITLAIRYAWLYSMGEAALRRRLNVLIVDCDAHQGNGYARDVARMESAERKNVYILDLFNPRIYPRDLRAREVIDREVHLPRGVDDQEYLRLLEFHLKAVIDIDKFWPELIIYNAGTDILRGDRLGRLAITPAGIERRDELVFRFAHNKGDIPLVMLLSGGYQRNNGEVVANSLANLISLQLIPAV